MAEIRIIDQRRVPALAPERKGKDDMVVQYAVDEVRGYMVRIPAEGISDQAILSAIMKDVELRGRLVGRTFKT